MQPSLKLQHRRAIALPSWPRQLKGHAAADAGRSALGAHPAPGALNWVQRVENFAPNSREKRQPRVETSPESADGWSLLDTESYVESGRPRQRTVFHFDSWERHRSPSRYWRHVTRWPRSTLLRGMALPVLYVIGVAAAVCLYQSIFQAGLLPATFPDVRASAKEWFQVVVLTSPALSLLLVFRTNASYERWDSARKMWGQVLHRSRDLVRQGLAWIPREKAGLRSMLCRWVPAFSKAMMCHLRKGEDLVKELEGSLLPHEIKAVLEASHRPNYILQVLAELVQAARLPTAVTLRMDQSLANFEDCLGDCERILDTPILLAYSRHTSRFLIAWLTMLPLALYSSMGWGTVPACGIIAFLLLGIKEITVTLEEPFSILALETIAGTALANVQELRATHCASPAGGMQCNGGVDPMSAAAMVSLTEMGRLGESVATGNGMQGGRKSGVHIGRSNGFRFTPVHH